MTEKELIQKALQARENAYTPYSHWAVGAALLCKDGKVYPGCNIENAAYTPTNCAERTAFFSAIVQGERKFDQIAIVGGVEGEDPTTYCAPCGVCRQVMREFCNPETFQIILGIDENTYKVYTLEELLPEGFGPENLGKEKVTE